MDEALGRQLRANILETLVARFDPAVSEYRAIEEALAAVEEPARLEALFKQALRAGELAAVVAAINAARVGSTEGG